MKYQLPAGYLELSPESQLLLCCSRTYVEPGQAHHIISILDAGLDWTRFVDDSLRHGVAGLVFENLGSIAPDKVPHTSWQVLERSAKENVARSLLMVAELLRILKRLRQAGITALPYKGPLLAVRAYNNLSLREFCDLDLLVPQKDVADICDRMAELGYKPSYRWTERELIARIPGQYVFTKRDSGCMVEVHTPQTMRYFPRPFDLLLLGSRLQSVSVAGNEMPCIPIEDLLPMLCVHGSTHFWSRLKWICDIAELVRNTPAIDWEQTKARARELGCERMLLLGLYLAKELLRAKFPESIFQHPADDGAIRRMSAQVYSLLFDHNSSPPGLVQRCRFRFCMSGGAWRGTRYCIRMAASSTEDDWSSSRTPRIWNSLLRPVRLAKKYGLASAKKELTRAT
jgi:Uncharacterised nucleotidyltransferase